MKILLVGGGGREHALAWKISQSPLVETIFATPGNDAIAALPKTSCTKDAPLALAQHTGFDLVVIGPEHPLCDGLADQLRARGILVYGPDAAGARLEGSKVYAKQCMRAWDIPTAAFEIGHSLDEARRHLAGWPVETDGVVVKADGLAAGKGVVVTHHRAEAERTLHDFFANPDSPIRAKAVVLERLLIGQEVSAFAICDGTDFRMLGYACDYKRIGDGDQGPNTGGMGGYAPLDWPAPAVKQIAEDVARKVLTGMRAAGTPFIGTLFIGLMVDGDRAGVLEFNVRFGDPETQILLPLMQSDLVPILRAAAGGDLARAGADAWQLHSGTAVHVVMASGGYPGAHGAPLALGQPIRFDQPALIGGTDPDAPVIFIAGAKVDAETWRNSGGRVLGITARGGTVATARAAAYAAVATVEFEHAQWRQDIGLRAT